MSEDPVILPSFGVSQGRILIVAPRVVATFTRQDAVLLRQSFDVALRPYSSLVTCLPLSNEIRWADLVIIWFAGRHALPTMAECLLLRRPCMVIVGGYEAAWVPDIGYGIRPGSMRHHLIHWVLARANRVLTVSEFSTGSLLARWPEFRQKYTLIHNGVDTVMFGKSADPRPADVLCVGMLGGDTIKKKGWDLYWNVAAAMPDLSFVAIGPAVDSRARQFIGSCPPNLRWIGPRYGLELAYEYQHTSVYFQGSRHESFSLSLAESMACGCIPVVSKAGALPEVAGEVGFYIEERSVESAVAAIRAALGAPESHRQRARERIVSNFSATRRGELLRAEIARILNEHRDPPSGP